jgi:restriction endonuclease Mrr
MSLTPREIASSIISNFDRSATVKVRDAVAQVLRGTGVNRYEVYEIADKMSPAVIENFQSVRPEELPFRLGDRDSTRLVGKLRSRFGDSVETATARRAAMFVEQMLESLLSLHHVKFETLSALSLRLAGADEAYALGTRDEGGIDIFGRIQVGTRKQIERGLIETNLLQRDKGVLFLGQCKRYQANIGRPEIQKFAEAVRECISKYKGNPKPPFQRVDPSYYKEGELCIPLFITTSTFTQPAEGAASSQSLFTITGRKLSEFLCSKMIGIVRENDRYQFSKEALTKWIDNQSHLVQYQGG